jgi:hypothetical protein
MLLDPWGKDQSALLTKIELGPMVSKTAKKEDPPGNQTDPG